MCMAIYGTPKVKKARKDHVFYKVLWELRPGKEYYAPFMETPTTLGKLYSDTKQDEFFFDPWISADPSKVGCSVGFGGYHLFKEKKGADACLDELENNWPGATWKKYIVVKAIVPKGTKYVEGYFNDCKSIVAKSVIYEEL